MQRPWQSFLLDLAGCQAKGSLASGIGLGRNRPSTKTPQTHSILLLTLCHVIQLGGQLSYLDLTSVTTCFRMVFEQTSLHLAVHLRIFAIQVIDSLNLVAQLFSGFRVIREF